ncbi:conserved hypothetical protein [Candidatus Desulfarcum epimagneticum]|uniref:Integrase catalytic domain-containing protein n=1 Tax=uncultured Desulfobacteraceae bacterium TaxID=218296 RepID=A0A484HD86_9BACT|nr:conserved hypothetical protein [uncultured Desulfobacteraceae bacterium]
MVRIREVLKTRGHDIPYSTLTRITRKMGLREESKKKRAGAYVFEPGQEFQHDTSPHHVTIGGKRIKAQCAGLAAAYSRRLYIQYYPAFTRFEAKDFLTRAIEYMGGGCGVCVIDNTSVIVARGSGPDAEIAPEMEAFGKMFNMAFVPHRILDPNRKAIIERNFSYVENNFLAGRTFGNWRDLNQRAQKWCDTVANKKYKRSLGMSPDEASVMERPHLQPLPRHVPPACKIFQRIVDMSGFVSVDVNRYSVPERLCGKRVEVHKTGERISVFHKNRKVADHQRVIGKRDAKVVHAGHHLIIRGKKSATLKEEKKLAGSFEALDQYVAALKKRCHGSGKMKLQRLLNLKRTYPESAYKKAVEEALHYGMFDLSRLENMILSYVAGDFFNMDMED